MKACLNPGQVKPGEPTSITFILEAEAIESSGSATGPPVMDIILPFPQPHHMHRIVFFPSWLDFLLERLQQQRVQYVVLNFLIPILI